MRKIDDYMFARWLVINYDSDYLNKISGAKWKELYEYYNVNVKPNFIKNKSYKENKAFLATPDIKPQEFITEVVTVPKHSAYDPDEFEDNGCNCGQPSCTFGCA